MWHCVLSWWLADMSPPFSFSGVSTELNLLYLQSYYICSHISQTVEILHEFSISSFSCILSQFITDETHSNTACHGLLQLTYH